MKSWLLGKFGLITLAVIIACLYTIFYFDLRIESMGAFRAIMVDRPNRSTKLILYWTKMFSDENFYFGKGDIFQDCPVNDCLATRDRGFVDVAEFDAILFHGNEFDRSDMPEKRGVHQWYIYVNLESPSNRPITHHYQENYFNATMTYRLDSDITWAYGAVRNRMTGEIVAPFENTTWTDPDTDAPEAEDSSRSSPTDPAKGKSKPVTWFVSNCQADSGRMLYVKELSKHIGIDIFGKCGNLTSSCPRSRDCYREVVEPKYFFYLSFENTMCRDYVTEKLYSTLRYNVVPIVYGGANYSLFAPPNSYVNALDFDSPKELADYLKSLINNPKEYAKYFRWKRKYSVDVGTKNTVCRLCEFLHRKRGHKVYSPLSEWYSVGKCPIQKLLAKDEYATRATLSRL